jgi:ABC-type cobalamin/Fe3+-siderophores transport system ATPase subunit
MLELKNITWSLPNGREVIKDVSLTIPKGKLVVVTGPNGGGKTTLAKIIAGIATPDSGKLFLEGEEIKLLNYNYNKESYLVKVMNINYAVDKKICEEIIVCEK